MARTNFIEYDFADRRPWERMETETSKSFAAFSLYRDLGPERSIAEAYRQWVQDSSKRAPQRFFVLWASEFRWRERAQAYDDHCERLKLKEREASIQEAAKRHVKQLRNFGAVLNKFEQILMRKMESNPDMKGVRLADLMNAAVRGASIIPRLQEAEMTALGKPNRVELTGKDGGPIAQTIRYIPPVVIEPQHKRSEESQEAEDMEDELQ
jgi:hypothetical protein